MNTLSVFVSIRKKGSKRLFRCLPKQGDYIGAFVFVNGAIKSVKAITPFNRFYSNVLSFGKLEIDEQNALMLLMQLVLFYVSETQRTLYDSFQFFIPNKKLADYLDKHTVELCKQYKLKNLKFYTVEKKENHQIAELTSEACLLTNEDYMVIDEKLSFLRKITNTTKALKQKEIDRLTSENAALTAKIETLQTLIQNQNMKGARHNGKIYV